MRYFIWILEVKACKGYEKFTSIKVINVFGNAVAVYKVVVLWVLLLLLLPLLLLPLQLLLLPLLLPQLLPPLPSAASTLTDADDVIFWKVVSKNPAAAIRVKVAGEAPLQSQFVVSSHKRLSGPQFPY